MPDVTTRSPCLHVGGARDVFHPQRVALPDDDALRARALDQRARRGVAIDEHLHLRRARARTESRGPTTPAGEITAMSGLRPSDDPLSIVMSRNSGLGAGGDDLGGDRLEPGALPEFEQLPQAVGPLRLGALLLQLHLQRLEFALELLVFASARRAARRSRVHSPRTPSNAVHRPALDLGERRRRSRPE